MSLHRPEVLSVADKVDRHVPQLVVPDAVVHAERQMVGAEADEAGFDLSAHRQSALTRCNQSFEKSIWMHVVLVQISAKV